jgi:CHASE3 domain sensor protein
MIQAMDEAVKQKNTEEMGDAMKALENRTIESKQEMDILAALDEMKSMRARHAMVGVEDMMQALRRTAEVKVSIIVGAYDMLHDRHRCGIF